MAEINIQRKSSNAIWWILAIVAIVLIAWFLMAGTGNEPITRGPAERLPAPVAAAGEPLTPA